MQIQVIVSINVCLRSSSNIWYFKAYGTARIYKKLEAKKEEKQSNTTNVDKADNKKDKFLDISV